jgi:hypothetical protein
MGERETASAGRRLGSRTGLRGSLQEGLCLRELLHRLQQAMPSAERSSVRRVEQGVLTGAIGVSLTLVILGAVSAGCDPCSLNKSGSECTESMTMLMQGRVATVELQTAVIGPGKFNHDTWDAGGGEVPTEVWSQLGTALAGTNPYVAVAALLVNPVLAGTQAPDPYGTARLDVGPTIGTTINLATPDNNMENTYTPTWAPSTIWTGVPLDKDVRIKVDLTDEDLVDDDAIGVAEINTSQLLEALNAHAVYHVPVASQTHNQLLFIGISVRE